MGRLCKMGPSQTSGGNRVILRSITLLLVALVSSLGGSFARGADAAQRKPAPLKVFILAGQSNMEGKAKVALMDYQAKQPATAPLFTHLRANGQWIERDDVWIKFLDRKGKLTVGYGSPGCIGPELGFGTVVGDHYREPVLLIKTAWGGRSLYRDFRPPSAGLPSKQVLENLLAARKKRDPGATMEQVKETFGKSYREMMSEVRSTLANLKSLFPQYENQGYELSGFVWFQGWNDMIDDTYTAQYADNLACLIRDIRHDLGVPGLPVVVGQMGVDGLHADAKMQRFKSAEAAGVDRPEFKGNVALVKTDAFWDKEADAVFKKGWRKNQALWDTVGSNYPFHYLGSAKTMLKIGQAFGKAMIELQPARSQVR